MSYTSRSNPVLRFIGAILTIVFLASSASAFTTNDADVAFNAFTKAYYVVSDGQGYYKDDSNGSRSAFWTQAEEIEMIIDAYERTGNPEWKKMINESIDGFIAYNGSDWQWNIYNDDIMWMVIACARAYTVTGDTNFRDRAKINFDLTYARAWDDALGGGLWWTTDKHEKNACVNGPAAIAACLLCQIYGDTNYLNKAQALYTWERNTLFDFDSGAVLDHIGADGAITAWLFTYNQGTFIGAANYLKTLTGASSYLDDAQKAASFTMKRMCAGGILPEYTAAGDSAGFTSIFARWMMCCIRDNDLWDTYYGWMLANADAAWNVRRADNLSWCKWRTSTPSGVLPSWSCSGSVVMLQVVPPEFKRGQPR